MKIGLRRFDFVRIGASNTSDGVAAQQTFNSFSVDVYPVSRVVRIGLTSAFGWESGTFVANGDYFATQTVSLGAQYRDFGRVVPFAEAFMGVGYMRRAAVRSNNPTAFWNFGADAGVEVYVARVGYLSLALGYMRPINGFARRQIFTQRVRRYLVGEDRHRHLRADRWPRACRGNPGAARADVDWCA